MRMCVFFFQAEDGIRDVAVTGVQTCALPLTYTSVTAPPVPIRARDVSDSAVVNEIGPYHSITANADVVTTTTGKVRGDSLNGTFEMRPAGGGNVIMSGNFRSKRVVP